MCGKFEWQLHRDIINALKWFSIAMCDIEDNKSSYNIKSLRKNKNALQYQIHSVRLKCALILLSSLRDKLSAIDEDINDRGVLNIENDVNIREKLEALESNMYSIPFNIHEYNNKSNSNELNIDSIYHQNKNPSISENVNILNMNELNTNQDILSNNNVSLTIKDRLWIIVSDAIQGLYNCRKKDSFDPKPLYRIAQTIHILAHNNNNNKLHISSSSSNMIDDAITGINIDDTYEQYNQSWKKSIVILLPPTPMWLLEAIGNSVRIFNGNGSGKGEEGENATDSTNIGNLINTTINNTNNNNSSHNVNLPTATNTNNTNSINHCTTFTIDMAYKEMYKMFDKKRDQIVAIWMSEIANNDLELVHILYIYKFSHTYKYTLYIHIHVDITTRCEI